MEQIAIVNDRKIFYHNLRQSAIEMPDVEPYTWAALFITAESDPYYKNGMSVCKRMKTPYVVCTGKSCDEASELFEMESFMIFEPNKELFEKCPLVWNLRGIADGFNNAIFFSVSEEAECTSVVCFDTTERGVKKYLISLTNEWNENQTFLTPEADEEEVEWDS
jgi:hypothetical protein